MRHWIDFKQLRSELNFAKIIEHYNVKLKARGKQLVGPCPLPFHEGDRKSDSFSAHVERGVFQCFSCHATGNVFDFAVLMEKRNLKNGDDLRKTGIELARVFSLQKIGAAYKTKPESPKPQAAREKQRELPQSEAERVIVNQPLDFELKDLDYDHPYLKGRGFSPETIQHFGLGFCPRGYFKNRIVIPIHSTEGRLIGYAGRVVDDKLITKENPRYLFPPPREINGARHEFKKSLVLYNQNRIMAPVQYLIIVEGFTAAWWLWQHHFGNVVAAMGDSMSETQTEQVARLTTESAHVWVVGDGDKAGAAFSSKVAQSVSTVRFTRQLALPMDSQPTDCSQEDLEAAFGFPKFET